MQLENHHKETRPTQPGLKAVVEVPAQERVNQPWSQANVVFLSNAFGLCIYHCHLFTTI